MPKKESSYGKKIISWEFADAPPEPRTQNWYFWIIVFGAILLTCAIVTVNFLFAIIVVLAAAVMVAASRRGERRLAFGIHEDGIALEDDFFPWKEIKYFWIIYEPPKIKNLYFEFQGAFRPRLKILLEDQDPVKIRAVLIKNLEENLERENEPLSDQINRVLRI